MIADAPKVPCLRDRRRRAVNLGDFVGLGYRGPRGNKTLDFVGRQGVGSLSSFPVILREFPVIASWVPCYF